MSLRRIDMKYMVRANVPFGPDDTYDCEYSGVEHQSRADAEKELEKAKNNKKINFAYIDEIET